MVHLGATLDAMINFWFQRSLTYKATFHDFLQREEFCRLHKKRAIYNLRSHLAFPIHRRHACTDIYFSQSLFENDVLMTTYMIFLTHAIDPRCVLATVLRLRPVICVFLLPPLLLPSPSFTAVHAQPKCWTSWMRPFCFVCGEGGWQWLRRIQVYALASTTLQYAPRSPS